MSRRAHRNNAITDRVIEVRDLYGKMEQLPKRLRMLLAHAPYNWDVSEMLDLYSRLKSAGMEIDDAVSHIEGKFAYGNGIEVRIQARVLYGVDHPQADKRLSDETLEKLGVLEIARANDQWRERGRQHDQRVDKFKDAERRRR